MNFTNDNTWLAGGSFADDILRTIERVIRKKARNTQNSDAQSPNTVTLQIQDELLQLTVSAEALDRIRVAIYECGADTWRSPTSLAARLGFTGDERRIAFALWALFGVDAARRMPCIDWDDQAPLFDECAAGEALEWREVNVTAFADKASAAEEVARVMATVRDVRILHCLLYTASGQGGFDFNDVYSVVDSFGVHLPETTLFCWTQIFLGNEHVDNGTGAWPVAGLLLRVASLS